MAPDSWAFTVIVTLVSTIVCQRFEFNQRQPGYAPNRLFVSFRVSTPAQQGNKRLI